MLPRSQFHIPHCAASTHTQTTKRVDIVIAGAGIGGLTAALSLHAAGFDHIAILEAAPCIEPLGVGVNLLPNAVRELDELGLLDELASPAVATRELLYYNRYGQRIWREPRGRAAGHLWPQLSIHRGQLHATLAAASTERSRSSVGSIWSLLRTGMVS